MVLPESKGRDTEHTTEDNESKLLVKGIVWVKEGKEARIFLSSDMHVSFLHVELTV
jgi:hypothetical protein